MEVIDDIEETVELAESPETEQPYDAENNDSDDPDGFVAGLKAALEELEQLDMPEEDGIPLESNWHRIQINLLADSVHAYWRDRTDYFAGGNMFIYFSTQQILNKDYKGPDFFLVKDAVEKADRRSWKIWREAGKYPDVIVELSSPSTIRTDFGEKKQLYERTFRTSEYFCYDPETQHLTGWRLERGRYKELVPNNQGRLKCDELGVWVGRWEGEYLRVKDVWLRFFTQTGELVPTLAEAEAKRANDEAKRAEVEARRAEAEAKRADDLSRRVEAAEAELNRLRALLAERSENLHDKK